MQADCLRRNLILDTDSPKASHWLQYPPGTTGMYSYLESRGGKYGTTLFFGLQYLLREYLEGQVVTMEDVEEARAFFAAHGEPFNRDAWALLVERHGGRLPIRVRAVAEGTVVPTHNILLTAESTDPDLFWVVSWLETMLVRLWYPITVATQSFYVKRDILDALTTSADDPLAELPWKLHDFGARGVSSRESAGIGGMAHLVNFQRSDTALGVRFANHYYDHPMAGFALPAADHSTVTMWGRARELDAYRNLVRSFAAPGKTVACVSDSFDLYRAVDEFWGDELRDQVRDSGGTVFIWPDSGDPAEGILRCLDILDRKVGTTKNTKGYKVLPRYYRIIQGDGVDPDSIRDIFVAMHGRRYSASNITFGMGGANLQKLHRDTQKFAFKCSEATVAGERVKVFKDPATDSTKRSRGGRLALVREEGHLRTVEGERKDDLLVPVFEDGRVLVRHTFEQVRQNAMRGLV